MKYIFTLLTLSIVFFIACNQENNIASTIMNTDNLEVQNFSINTTQDTTIITKDGLKVKIKAGSIESSNDVVTLEIKEAITLEAMLKAGLTTQTGKGILSSDGMFYIATKETSVIKSAIEVSVPTFYADNKMQLYKGEEADGKINWKDPEPITNMQTAITDKGEILFKQNCASCHAVDKQLTGPALAWVDKRKGGEWLYKYTKNNQQLIRDGDKYACCIYNKYYKTAMNVFPNLSDKDIDALYRYIDKEAKRLNVPEDAKFTDCDSCDYYAHYYGKYYNDIIAKRDSLIKSNGKFENVKIVQPADADTMRDKIGIPTKVSPNKDYAEYYQINISAYGWYNIDVLLDIKYGAVKSKVMVRLQGEYQMNASLFFIIPSQKIFAEGGRLADNKGYGFYDEDGSIFLTQGLDAFVIAVQEQNAKLYFQQRHFITSPDQTIMLSLEESDKASILASYEMLKFNDINLSISKTKNFEDIKALDTELSNILNKINSCSCIEYADTTSVYK